MGAFLGIFLHELGHTVIAELDLPAVGPEEDVADEFAAMVFVYNMRADPRFRDVALWTPKLRLARANQQERQRQQRKGSSSEEEAEREYQRSLLFDEHSPDLVRYSKILCILAGAEPEYYEKAGERDRSGG